MVLGLLRLDGASFALSCAKESQCVHAPPGAAEAMLHSKRLSNVSTHSLLESVGLLQSSGH